MSQTMKIDSNTIRQSRDGGEPLSKTGKRETKSPDKKSTQGTMYKVDALNQWDYCNPENQKDELPQPYRFVNKVLQQMILKEVYSNIFEIEKYKENPNYEGHLKQLPPQGSFELDGITFMTKNNNNPNNIIIAGDKFGNLLLLDLNKKTQIQKKEATPGKRITYIHSQTVPYADQHLTTFCVVSRAEPKVNIFRYITPENRMFNNYSIKITKDYTNNSTIGEFPQAAVLSQDSDYITITTYKGDVLIYRIPEPPQPILETFDETQGGVNQMSKSGQHDKPKISSKISFDKPCIEIKEPFYKIKFPGNKKELTYQELMKKIAEENQALYRDPTEANLEAAQNIKEKKDTKKGGKEVVEVVEEVNKQLEFSEDPIWPAYKKSESGADISLDHIALKFNANVFFTYAYLPLQKTNKMFSRVKMVSLTTGIYVTWTNTKIVQNHKFQQGRPEYLQSYLYSMYFGDTQFPNKQEELKKALPVFEKKMIQSSSVIYPITISAINETSTFLALGLKDGSIIIWDLCLDAEKCYLDKHLQQVTCLNFLQSSKLISGSQDGGVHIYNVSKGKMEMKRTNLFKEKKEYSIVDIKVSESGVAFVIDSLNNLRIYDMWHSEKIGRMDPKGQQESKIVGWNLFPNTVMDASKDQLCIVCVVNKDKKNLEDNLDNNTWNKNTNVQIFRIFDGLINLFPGLSNVFRRGIERDKIVNLYSRITFKELKDPAFEIPTIGIQQMLSFPGQQQDKTSNSNAKSNRSKSNKKGSNERTGGAKKGKTLSKISGSNDNGSVEDLNSSFKTHITHVSTNKQKIVKKPGLTKELLHPEEYLLDKYRDVHEELTDEKAVAVEESRKRNADKTQRQNLIANNLLKIKQDLQIQEEKRLLKKKKELLKKE